MGLLARTSTGTRADRTAGVPTVAVYSDIEEDAQHVRMADRAVRIGAAAPAESYLNIPRLLQAAAETGAKAVHPGYGFLSENAEFAGAVTNAGLRFVGPSAETMAVMGDKRQAKLAMEAAGVPVVPGYHGEGSDAAALAEEARRVGFPLLIKAVMGGGGKGMKLVHQPAQLEEAVASAQREAQAAFGDARLLLERFIQRPRHIEVQIVAEAGGRNVVDVFERDCSVQRRHQKVLEEAPAPCLDADTRSTVRRLAVEAAKAVGYENAGTVEFILDTDTGELFFMEMNTRLQVEHPVSEMVAGIDLVEWQLRAAAGLSLPLQQLPAEPQGHAIEARVYAENPQRSFLPGAGRLRRWRLPRGAALLQDAPTAEAAAREVVRVDSGLREGDEVGVSYDPLLAKVICHAGSRGAALTGLEAALAQLQVAGVANNVQLLRDVLRHPDFQRGGVGTHFLQDHLQQLLAVPPAPAKVQAIAAALLWWLQAQAASSADAASAPSPAMSAWLAPDALRLHHLHSEATTVQEDHGADTGPDAAQLMLTIASPDRLLVSSASHAEAGIGGVCVRKLDLGADWAVLDVDGERCSLDFSWFQHSERQQLDMWRDGQHYSFCIPHPRFELQGRDGSSSSSAVLSPMPGRITKVLVRDGQAVDQGQTVVVMEAMKMETPLKAPSSGSLQLLVAEGQQVEVDQLLFRVGNTAKEDAQH